MKTELKLLKVRYTRQQKIISDIDVEVISIIQRQFNESISENLIQSWKDECVALEQKAKTKFTLKEKWFKENWTFEHQYKQEEDNKPKPNNKKDKEKVQYQQRKPPPTDFFNLTRRKSEDSNPQQNTYDNLEEDLNITNDPLLNELEEMENEPTQRDNNEEQIETNDNFLGENPSQTRWE